METYGVVRSMPGPPFTRDVETRNHRLFADKQTSFYSEKFYRTFGFKRTGEIHLPDGKSEIVLIEMKKSLSQLEIANFNKGIYSDRTTKRRPACNAHRLVLENNI